MSALALWCVVAAATPLPPAKWMQLGPAERAAEHAQAAPLPLEARIDFFSEGFLRTPYAVSPLGEGEGIDPDPTIRFDAVDCLTFVEETMALALAKTDEEVEPLLEQIRYGQKKSYVDRNHLMEVEWLPGNEQKGFLRNVTRRAGGADVQRVEKHITLATWRSKTSKALQLPPERQLTGRFALDVVPLDKAYERARALPTGTLVIIVRDDKPLLPTRVSHLGFLIQKKQRTVLRHASRTHGHVVDEDLKTFLARHGKYTKKKITGLSFYEVVARP